MKKLVVISIISFGIIFTACKKDDECLNPDVITGTYTGTKECDDTTPVSITFQAMKGASDNQIIVDSVTVVIDDCNIFGSTVVQGTGREIDGDIDGNKISFVETIKVNGQADFRCVWEGIKN